MFGRLATFVAATLTALLVGGTASASTYGNGVSTSCNVSVIARAHQAVRAHIDVKGNASNAIHGTVTITVTGGSSAARSVRSARAARTVWSTSVRYNGSPLTITGPVLPAGHYHAAAHFSADPGVYLDCSCFASFSARNASNEHRGGPHSGSGLPGGGLPGGLPNTGGPSKWWLVLGFALTLAGGASVYGSRGRRHHKVRARTFR